MSNVLNTYRPFDMHLTHGDGIYLWDKDNNKYLDALCGVAVTGLGHNHPEVTRTIQQQGAKLLHTSNLFVIPEQERLASFIAQHSGLDLGFFCNSGCEAVEGLIKFARLYGHRILNLEAPKIITFKGSFHGRTIATISAGSNVKYQEGFGPLLEGFILAQYNNIQELEFLAQKHSDIAAILVEPVQGESGVNVPDPGYLAELRRICDKYKWLLLSDEVQTGNGRAGKLFAYQAENILPDGFCTAKGLANGIPIGCFFIDKKYGDLFTPGSHGSTFGGNPFATSVAFTTLNFIIKNKLWENAEREGNYLLQNFKKLFSDYPQVVDIRGKGLLLGIELNNPCREFLPIVFKNKLIVNVAGDRVIRLLPPLIITREHSDFIIEAIGSSLREYLSH